MVKDLEYRTVLGDTIEGLLLGQKRSRLCIRRRCLKHHLYIRKMPFMRVGALFDKNKGFTSEVVLYSKFLFGWVMRVRRCTFR